MPIELKPDTSHYDKCRTMMKTHEKHHKTRLIISSFIILFNSFFLITLPVTFGLIYTYGFSFGMVAFVYGIGILALMLFAVPEKPKFLILAGLLTIAGMIIGIVHLIFGILLLIVCITQIPECRQALWMQKQPGYPYFNERFDDQMQVFGKEYQSAHTLDHVRDAEMLDAPEQGCPDFIVQPKTEMPEIPDISE